MGDTPDAVIRLMEERNRVVKHYLQLRERLEKEAGSLKPHKVEALKRQLESASALLDEIDLTLRMLGSIVSSRPERVASDGGAAAGARSPQTGKPRARVVELPLRPGPVHTQEGAPHAFSAPISAGSRFELREQWRNRLKAAEERYHYAAAEFRKALHEQNQGLTQAPDGAYAIRRSRIMESSARTEYIRLLRIFSDLLLYDKVPDEPPTNAPD